MTAEEQIEQAEYFFKEIINTYKNETEVRHTISAFLTSVRSIPDHLLEDFNKRWNLGITFTDFLNSDTIRNCKGDNQFWAVRFADWYDKKLKSFKNDPIVSFMMEKRRLGVHRTTQKPTSVAVTVSHQIFNPFVELELPSEFSIWRQLGLINQNIKHELEEIEVKNNSNSLPFKSMKLWNQLYFDDLDSMIELTKACFIYLNAMKVFVFEAHLLFFSPP